MLALFGDDPKDAPKGDKPTERLFTDDEVMRIENTMLKIALAQKEFKIEEYKQRIAQPASVQISIITAACESVGVPKDKIQTECGTSGFAEDGGPAKGPDGKLIPRKVWHQLPEKAADKK